MLKAVVERGHLDKNKKIKSISSIPVAPLNKLCADFGLPAKKRKRMESLEDLRKFISGGTNTRQSAPLAISAPPNKKSKKKGEKESD